MLSKFVICSFSRDELYRIIYKEAHNSAYTSYLRGMRCKTEEDFFVKYLRPSNSHGVSEKIGLYLMNVFVI